MEKKPAVCGRFAPSPSGRMHLGNLWSCLLAWLAARSQGGRMVLRLEDLDPDRCTQDWCSQVMRDLEWLGLDWDNEPVYQSRRTDIYRSAFAQLEERGLIYPCYCTRAERLAASAPHRSDGVVIYDGRCRRLSLQEREELASARRPAWRVEVPEETVSFVDRIQGPFSQNLAHECGDFILRRSDGVYAYQLAVVVDDAAMGVTRWCGGATCWTPPQGRSGSRRSLGSLTRSTAMCPCSWPLTGGGWPSGTGTRSWGSSSPGTPPRSWWAGWPIWRGSSRSPSPSPRRSWSPCFPGKSSPKRTGPRPGSPAFRHLSQIVGNQQKALERPRLSV